MVIANAKYADGGMIVAIIDGQEWHIPDNMANGHRQMVARWEAEGNSIKALEDENQS